MQKESHCSSHSPPSGTEGSFALRHQRDPTAELVPHGPSQHAAVLRRHVRHWKPKQPDVFPEGTRVPISLQSLLLSGPSSLSVKFFSSFLVSSHLFVASPRQKEEVSLLYDRHTLFIPPSPKPNTSLPPQRSKVCPSACLFFPSFLDLSVSFCLQCSPLLCSRFAYWYESLLLLLAT